MYRHTENVISSGSPLSEAKNVLIILHGRGADAQSIIALAKHFKLTDSAILAPEATNHSWYPYSFLAAAEENQPALDSALEIIQTIVDDLHDKGFEDKNIFFAGFSQGACLTLEYAARNAARYGGIIAFTGGLIGKVLERSNYKGDFQQTPILLTTGNPDPHVPLQRVEESASLLEELNGRVTMKVFNNRPHTISAQEIDLANHIIFGA